MFFKMKSTLSGDFRPLSSINTLQNASILPLIFSYPTKTLRSAKKSWKCWPQEQLAAIVLEVGFTFFNQRNGRKKKEGRDGYTPPFSTCPLKSDNFKRKGSIVQPSISGDIR